VSVYGKRLPSCIAAPRIAGGANARASDLDDMTAFVITATVSRKHRA
jgi:hypothetical protein